MRSTSLLSYGERRRINLVQQRLGISPARMAHISQTNANWLKLLRGEKKSFWQMMLPENRRFEDRKTYLSHIEWLVDTKGSLSLEDQRNLEIGIRLHDIGYAVTNGGDHPQKGEVLLRDDIICSSLGLFSPNNRKLISSIVGYHGFFTDIGFLFPADKIKQFDSEEIKSLAIMCALDSTSKPFGSRFHNMLFSRILERIISPDISTEDRIRQLFGPPNVVWLEENDFSTFHKLLEKTGTLSEPGFETILNNTYFLCWPVLKDLVTPEVIPYNHKIFIDFDPECASDLARFLFVVSRVIDKLAPSERIEVNTGFDYFKGNRPLFLERLRRNLEGENLDPVQRSKNEFRVGDITFKVEKAERKMVVSIG